MRSNHPAGNYPPRLTRPEITSCFGALMMKRLKNGKNGVISRYFALVLDGIFWVRSRAA